MENAITLKFDAGKLPKTGMRKSRSDSHPGKNRNTGRVPRIARLMALAIHLQKLIDAGAVRDYAEIARLTGLTRARVTQIMNLTLLAPGIQEEILFLPRVQNGHDPIAERNIRKITAEPIWINQKPLWEEVNTSRECGNIAPLPGDHVELKNQQIAEIT
jgi:alkylated DNA nucleotide flippase Atl1